jgi:hypothetical protein
MAFANVDVTVKLILKKWPGIIWPGSGPVEGSCKQGNNPSDSITCCEFIYELLVSQGLSSKELGDILKAIHIFAQIPNFITLRPAELHAREEFPNIKTEDVIMCCLARPMAHFRGR